MRIFITGGTGLIGKALIQTLSLQGHAMTVFSRDINKAKLELGEQIDYCSSLDDLKSLDGYDAIINLAGESIAKKRWTKKQKEKLCSSRWNITRRLTELIKMSTTAPRVFISGSAIGYYGAQKDNIINENTEPHDSITFQLCKKWEELAMAADGRHTRVCTLRTGVVLSNEGGALPVLTFPFRIGLGGVLGSGKQYISWIHIDDMVNGIIFLLNTPEARGSFNFTSPNPVTNRRFCNILSKTLYRPRIFQIPSFLLKLFIGEGATLITDGQRAIPEHLLDMRFRFRFEYLDEAIKDLLHK